jgi:hypothetical protein
MEKMKPTFDWIRARRKLIRQVKDEVTSRTGPEPRDVLADRLLHERELAKPWVASDKEQLLREVELADIVYGGDFHALGQAQKTHLKILRSLKTRRPVVLGLEAFPTSSQKWIDLYLAGELTLDELRAKTRWDQTWGFPWENYRPLLELALKRGFKVLALSQVRSLKTSLKKVDKVAGDLRRREDVAAEVIVSALLRSRARSSAPHQGILIYAIFGDLHLSPQNLPERVRRCWQKKDSTLDRKNLVTVTVYLNSERVYFQLAKRGLEHSVDVVRYGPGRFCVMSSPPWVQWQSYLMFLDQVADTDSATPYPSATDQGSTDFDPTDQVSALIQLACSDLKIRLKSDGLAVYGADDSRIWAAIEAHLKKKSQRQVAQILVLEGRSFFIPSGGIGYLSPPTVNHAAQLAGQYIHTRLSSRKRPLWDFPADFRALIWTEATGFFISKLINHKRQSETLADLKQQLAAQNSGLRTREALRLVLDHQMSELIFLEQGRQRRVRVRPRRKTSYLQAARILGGMMGERLYLSYRSRKLNAKALVALMERDVEAPDFARTYDEIVRVLARAFESSPLADEARVKTKKERL